MVLFYFIGQMKTVFESAFRSFIASSKGERSECSTGKGLRLLLIKYLTSRMIMTREINIIPRNIIPEIIDHLYFHDRFDIPQFMPVLSACA
jgi:hypothetical protein